MRGKCANGSEGCPVELRARRRLGMDPRPPDLPHGGRLEREELINTLSGAITVFEVL